MNPGDTRRRSREERCRVAAAQPRPGREPRRHFMNRRTGAAQTGPLNQGRGVNPGDTWCGCSHHPSCWPAQPRPGREPRRHVEFEVECHRCMRAQPRPGREPRRHAAAAVSPSGSHVAQPRPGREPRRHARRRLRRRPTRRALNQGRGVNPGDTAKFVRRGAIETQQPGTVDIFAQI